MDYARLKRWVDASQWLKKLDELMLLPAQQLGRFDCQLVAASPGFATCETIEMKMAFQDHIGLSYLWVLGGYELVRTIDQRFRDAPSLASAELRSQTSLVKRGFERARVPLAKFEPAHRHRDNDFGFAWPAYEPDRGVAWTVAQNTYVSRSELANSLLLLLETIGGAKAPVLV
jgi:hypothetical protein